MSSLTVTPCETESGADTEPSCPCSRKIGASFIKVVNIFTVDTVTNNKNAVSIIAHFVSF